METNKKLAMGVTAPMANAEPSVNSLTGSPQEYFIPLRTSAERLAKKDMSQAREFAAAYWLLERWRETGEFAPDSFAKLPGWAQAGIALVVKRAGGADGR